jgi:hypothetical protein
MADKSEALRLADALDRWHEGVFPCEAAAELRRLHAVNRELLEALRLTSIDCQYLHHAHKDRHLLFEECPVVARINAAIAKAEGENV